jgi:hypothetical protein
MNQLILGSDCVFKGILHTDIKDNEGLEAVEVIKIKVNGEITINQ